jgi:hypothetical protein
MVSCEANLLHRFDPARKSPTSEAGSGVTADARCAKADAACTLKR